MQIRLTLMCILCSLIVRGQITFTRNDYGKNGDLVFYAVDSLASASYNYGATGTNYTWRFNTRKMYPKRYDSTLFVTVTGNPNAPQITANILLQGAFTKQYQEVTDSFVKTIFDYPQYRINGVKLRLCNFPLTYQNSTIDSTTATTKGIFSEFGLDPVQGFDSIRFNARIKLKSDCDGWGSIVLPDSSNHNALRLKTSIFIDADIYLHSILGWVYVTNRKQTNTNYAWYGNGSKNYLANVVLDTSGNYSSFTYAITSIPPKIIPATLVSITPDSIYQGDTVSITIKGNHTHFTQGTIDYMYISYCTIQSINVIDDTTLTAVVCSKYSSPAGKYYVEVRDPISGYIYLNNALTILPSPNAPKLLSISPNYGSRGQTIDMIINGQHTHFTKGTTVNFNMPAKGGLFLQSYTIINDSLLSCKVYIDQATDTASFSLYTSNSVDGSLSITNIFSVVTTGINEKIELSSISLFPNPANQILTINKQNSEPLLLQLINATGTLVNSYRLTEKTTSINTSDLPDGIYFCMMVGSKGTRNQKILITHK